MDGTSGTARSVYGRGQYFGGAADGTAFDFTEKAGHVIAMRLADDAVVTTMENIAQLRARFLVHPDVPEALKAWVRGDQGARFAALIGVDAYTANIVGGDYLIVINRAKVLVDARSLPKGQFYRRFATPGVDPRAKAKEVQEEIVKSWDRFAKKTAAASPEERQAMIDKIAKLQEEHWDWSEQADALEDWEGAVKEIFKEEYSD